MVSHSPLQQLKNGRKRKWFDVHHQREFLAEIAPKLGVNQVPHLHNFPALCAKLFFKKPKDWFSINRHEVEKCGGRSLFKIYRSFPEALQVIFPDLRDSLVEAQIQQTSRAPAGFWQNKEHQKQLIERVGKELGVKEV